MSEKMIGLSGAATDVLYALFFRGALHSGNLPSKSGAAVLHELGFAETRHTETDYMNTNHFTFLTPEGQAFAVEHLVNTRFGVKVDKKDISSSITIGIELDTSHVQKALDEIEASVRNSELFSVRKGEVFIKDALITATTPVAVKLLACTGKSPTASAVLQDHKQHTLAGEIAPATYKASLGISCNDLAEETLSAVLGATLPGIPINRVEEAAITVARAVRSAFNALDKDNASPR